MLNVIEMLLRVFNCERLHAAMVTRAHVRFFFFSNKKNIQLRNTEKKLNRSVRTRTNRIANNQCLLGPKEKCLAVRSGYAVFTYELSLRRRKIKIKNKFAVKIAIVIGCDLAGGV